MSRKTHLIEVSPEQLSKRQKARLVAAAVLLVSFAAFVAFAPEPNPAPFAAPVAAVDR